MWNVDVAAMLKKYRKEAGLSVKEAVLKLKELGIEISDKTMYSWESGHRQPDADTFMALCEIYGVTSFAKETEKAPDSIIKESETDIEKRVNSLAAAFEACGYIEPGSDLTDEQLKFCMGLVDFLDRYFGG